MRVSGVGPWGVEGIAGLVLVGIDFLGWVGGAAVELLPLGVGTAGNLIVPDEHAELVAEGGAHFLREMWEDETVTSGGLSVRGLNVR